MIKAIWKPLIGYEGYYEVSQFKEIRSVDREIKSIRNSTRKIKGKNIRPYERYGRKYVQLFKKGNKKILFLDNIGKQLNEH